MKTRKLFSLLALAAMTLAATAQNLVGQWAITMPMTESGLSGTMILLFDIQNNSVLEVGVGFDLSGNIDEETKMSVTIGSTAQGTWENTGDQLHIVCDTDNITTEVEDMNFEGMNESMNKTMRALIEPEFLKEMKPNFEELMKNFKDVKFTITKLTNDQLTLNDGNDEMSFVRIDE